MEDGTCTRLAASRQMVTFFSFSLTFSRFELFPIDFPLNLSAGVVQPMRQSWRMSRRRRCAALCTPSTGPSKVKTLAFRHRVQTLQIPLPKFAGVDRHYNAEHLPVTAGGIAACAAPLVGLIAERAFGFQVRPEQQNDMLVLPRLTFTLSHCSLRLERRSILSSACL